MTSSALQALKAAASAIPKDTASLHEELHGQSDRASVILLATSLEDAIEVRLKASMRELSKGDYDRLFTGHAPLATFSAKIDLAWALELYGPKTRRDLHLVRELRNACAHSKQPLFFAAELGAVALLLDTPVRAPHVDHDQWPEPKDRFVLTCMLLTKALVEATEGLVEEVILS